MVSAMPTSLDTTVFFLVNRGMANPFFDVLMPLLSARGFLLAFPVLVLAVVTAWRQSTKEHFRSAHFALLVLVVPVGMFFLADMLNDMLKDILARSRPCEALDGVRLLVRCPRSFSMPSGHAIASFAFSVSFFILSRDILSGGWRWYTLVLAGLIGFSRMYIGVHYPSDIIVGTALGSGLAAAASAPLLRLSVPYRRRREEGTLRILRRNAQSGKVKKGKRTS